MFEQTFKNIDDILHKDAGCGSELDYVEQTSWILFLKYLDDLDKDKKTVAELSGKTHTSIISSEYKWEVWAVPKDENGKINHHKTLTGDDLKDFVDHKLFPYLKKFKIDSENADTIEYKIGEIFSELKNRIQSGYNLREILNKIDELRFRSHAYIDKHPMLSELVKWYLEVRLESESEYLFVGQRGAFERNAVNLILNKYGDRVNVKVTPHMLRHTLGYRLVKSTPLTTIQQILGHDHVSTTNIYTLTTEKDMTEALANIEW